jgi:hypothetical protein
VFNVAFLESNFIEICTAVWKIHLERQTLSPHIRWFYELCVRLIFGAAESRVTVVPSYVGYICSQGHYVYVRLQTARR